MTDNEIIKGLEYCINNNGICEDCPLLNKRNSSIECTNELIRDALDLINRQKAEIEELRESKKPTKEMLIKCAELIDKIKAGAIREFAEKLKENLAVDCDRVCERSSLLCGNISGYPIYEVEDCIDSLVKEMVGEDNA